MKAKISEKKIFQASENNPVAKEVFEILFPEVFKKEQQKIRLYRRKDEDAGNKEVVVFGNGGWVVSVKDSTNKLILNTDVFKFKLKNNELFVGRKKRKLYNL